MQLTEIKQNAIRKARISLMRVAYQRLPIGGAAFRCPICLYKGPFMAAPFDTPRRNAICPRCLSAERHRLQRLVCDEVFNGLWNPTGKTLLQFAPDAMTPYLTQRFGEVICADIRSTKRSIVLDMRAIDMENQSVDAVFASHVLEHIREDRTALQEVHRILKPGGIAILPVPVVSNATVEYPEAVPTEAYHWRAPGVDYFDRYREVFESVRIFGSNDFDEAYQTFDFGNRTAINRKLNPYRHPMAGEKHPDFVPICFKTQLA